MEEENRQEYYMNVLERIVDREKEELGEQVALKWARKTPLKVNENGEITGFYGKGEDAVEILRNYTEHQEFYLEAIQQVVDKFSNIFGQKISYRYARRAPLEITPEGKVEAYYGTGRNALQTLVNQYERYMGEQTSNSKIRKALKDTPEDKYELLPEEIQPKKKNKGGNGLLDRIASKINTYK
jgi:hypothetical protein